MGERCIDAMECRPEDLRCALSIHTQKITDSCRDKDCIEDVRVYLTRESQAVLDTAAAAKVRSAELICTAIDVSPVAFQNAPMCSGREAVGFLWGSALLQCRKCIDFWQFNKKSEK